MNAGTPILVVMTTGAPTDTAIAAAQPRRAVIDGAWRAIGPGVEVLSSDDGGPLRRTVKRIIDPLVLRLRSNPQYSAPLVVAGGAPLRCTTIVSQGPRAAGPPQRGSSSSNSSGAGCE